LLRRSFKKLRADVNPGRGWEFFVGVLCEKQRQSRKETESEKGRKD
jgi:hypothetical protein